MENLNKRIDALEKTINNLVNVMKKVEDVKKKEDLYSFSTQQLIKWLKENEVDYTNDIKDTLIDIVWTNLNEWEWDYYYDDEEEEEETEEEASGSGSGSGSGDDSDSGDKPSKSKLKK
jgi:hypothetical protein